MLLPFIQTQIRELSLMQSRWKSLIDPILRNPSNGGLILSNVILAIGTNRINHNLGQKLQGWKLVRKRAAASIYDVQDVNQTPQFTLNLVSDAIVSVDLEVF